MDITRFRVDKPSPSVRELSHKGNKPRRQENERMNYEIIDNEDGLNLYKFIVADGETVLIWAKGVN
jgi:hypothetical protein